MRGPPYPTTPSKPWNWVNTQSILTTYSLNSHTMKATGFQLVEVVNPKDGVTSKKLRVKFDTCVAINLLMPRDTTLEELMADIKADRDTYLAKVQVREGEYGQYCVFSLAKIEDEF